ncbi:putative ankyrin repeat protein RBE_0220 [Haliotis rufescens]|uniref:putative ankyrin repeat protein RBE_0220 n=1 Tax=Haliotis rufescens TaxID=6454 RepID=UPI00201F2859|nr:putative ankyrin repeat protein RBE_0220 [Haliotis rufescens]
MAIFVRSTSSSVTYKFLIQDVGGEVTMDEMKAVQGLEKPDNMKWNSDGGENQAQNQTIDNTKLIDACTIGDLPQAKYILSQDTVDINTRVKNGTPAMIAAGKGHREILELLVKKGADLSLLDDDDNSILHVACKEGNVEIVKYIHSQNIIDIESMGDFEKTPVMFAAESGKMEVFSFLKEVESDSLPEKLKVVLLFVHQICHARWQEQSPGVDQI